MTNIEDLSTALETAKTNYTDGKNGVNQAEAYRQQTLAGLRLIADGIGTLLRGTVVDDFRAATEHLSTAAHDFHNGGGVISAVIDGSASKTGQMAAEEGFAAAASLLGHPASLGRYHNNVKVHEASASIHYMGVDLQQAEQHARAAITALESLGVDLHDAADHGNTAVFSVEQYQRKAVQG